MSHPLLRLALLLIAAAPVALAVQTSAPPVAAPIAATSSPLPPSPSRIVQPALTDLISTLDSLRIDKWKAPAAVRQNAAANLASVRTDLDSNLPSLLHVADGSPGSLTAVLPAERNLDALYDVVLRVTETAHLAAPDRQSSDLDAALANLDQARRNLSAHILTTAQKNEADMQSLRQQLAARPVAPPPPEPKPCPKPPATKKRAVKKKAPDA